jgi:hypothetical protein
MGDFLMTLNLPGGCSWCDARRFRGADQRTETGSDRGLRTGVFFEMIGFDLHLEVSMTAVSQEGPRVPPGRKLENESR